MKKYIIQDHIGKQYGNITVLEFSHTTNGMDFVSYRCICGKTSCTTISRIVNKKIVSCGCMNDTRYKPTHGMYYSKIYKVYSSIIDRTRNKKHKHYPDYGGRGITCSWNSFEEFYSDMGSTYAEGLSIDRMNNDKGYFKENCRWIKLGEQQGNKRNNLLIENSGFTFHLAQWSRILGISEYKSKRFLCGKKGSVIDLVMELNKCDLKTAIQTLKSYL